MNMPYKPSVVQNSDDYAASVSLGGGSTYHGGVAP